MAAQKFNNGQKLGVVREILNHNADEIDLKISLAADSPIKYIDIWAMTQEAYDALPVKIATRKYEIFG